MGIFHSIPRNYLFIYASTVSCKTPNEISVEHLLENTVLETVNGST
jgi:hypothetical protein